jgi:uncharacterized protein (TIGR03437 family)
VKSNHALRGLLAFLLGAPLLAQAPAYSPAILTQPDGSGNTVGLVLHSFSYLVTAQNPAQPGEVLTLFATGLGPTNPAVAAGAPAPFSPPAVTTTIPAVSLGCQQASVISSALAPGAVGIYQVIFALPAGAAGGGQSLSLTIGGKTSSTVMLPVVGLPGPAINAVVSTASFALGAPIVAGSIVTVFGCGFGTADNLSLFPATTFQQLSVTFNGTPAPLFHVIASANQIDLLVPAELPSSGTVTVQLNSGGGASSSFTLLAAAASPGIFRITDPSKPSRHNVAALFSNTAWLPMPTSMAQALGIPINCTAGGVETALLCGQPAQAGDVIQLFVTGLGKATPGGDPNGSPLPTGTVAPANGSPLYQTVLAPKVTIGGVSAQILFSGIAPGFAGLYQINLQVPTGVAPGDDVSVQ